MYAAPFNFEFVAGQLNGATVERIKVFDGNQFVYGFDHPAKTLRDSPLSILNLFELSNITGHSYQTNYFAVIILERDLTIHYPAPLMLIPGQEYLLTDNRLAGL